ncbi:MAG TPA: hypothetical protein VLY04_04995, partial [Bryobacteraceae bacterium]|nr:hypothetical protein [Bryobacteraceae bacterium]
TVAEHTATSMFAGIGISVAWRMGELNSAPSGSVAIRLTVTDGAPPDSEPGVLATSYPYAGADRGITVFYRRIRESAARTVPEQLLLAHVLAHEIAHVLEGIDRHSEEGIMKAHWSRRDFVAMQKEPLPFAPIDIDLIHLGLEASGGMARGAGGGLTHPTASAQTFEPGSRAGRATGNEW